MGVHGKPELALQYVVNGGDEASGQRQEHEVGVHGKGLMIAICAASQVIANWGPA